MKFRPALLALATCLGFAACGHSDPTGSPDPTHTPPPSGDPSASLYDPDRVIHVDLTLPQSSIDALAADPTLYAAASAVIDGETVPSLGVRLKGEYNYRDLSAKSAFKLKFGTRFRGLKKMTLNNCLEDPSFVAERLVYTVYRAANVVAPRANSALVTVNGAPYGVYVNIEAEDKTMMARWFTNAQGNLYEELGSDFVPGAETNFNLETNTVADDRTDLVALIAAVEAASAPGADVTATLAPVLDWTEFLRESAIEGLVNQWDGYGYTQFGPNNFRIYHDPADGRFRFIPWGHDMSLKGYGGSDWVDLFDVRGRILQECMGDAACHDAYVQTMKDMTDLFEAQGLPALAARFHDQIWTDVLADPRKETSNDDDDAVYAGVAQFVADRPAVARAQLTPAP